jgi:NodT family efflux transporter outer membrane factor (OMF) lipoprotein
VRRALLAFALCGTGLAGGCLSPPGPPGPPEQAMTPQAWRIAPAEGHVTEMAWADLQEVRLDALIARALTANPDIEALALNTELARIGIRDARAARDPSLLVSGPNASLQEGDAGSASTAAVSASARYEIDLWGRLAAGVRLQEIAAENADTVLRGFRVTLAAAVAGAYYDLRLQDELLRLRVRQLENTEQLLTLTETRLSAGAITRLEIDQLEVEILRLRSAIEDARGQRAFAEQQMAILIGSPPGDFTLEPVELVFSEPPRLAPGTPAAVLAARPDIQIAERGLEAAGLSSHLARTAYFPTVSLTGSAGALSPDLSDFLSVRESWSVGAQLASTLFDSGARTRAAERARIGAEQAGLSWRAAVLQALSDVETSLLFQDQNIRQTALLDQRLQAQERVSRATRSRYEAGVASAFELIAEQQLEIGLREQRAQNWRQSRAAAIGLLRALAVDP